MDHALSLKTGDFVKALRSNYSTSRNLLLVCPECGEPVHYKLRQSPHKTPFFSHPKEGESLKLIKQCSLRADGGEWKPATSVISGLSHGQLVNRFQREFCKSLLDSLGPHATTLTAFLHESRFLRLDHSTYSSVLRQIEELTVFEELMDSVLSDSERQLFLEGVHDVCLFLGSTQGIWVGNFIYQAAYFVACMVHPDSVNKNLGRGVHQAKKGGVTFVAEPYRLKKWQSFAEEVLPARNKRNLAIPQIASSLVSYLLMKWRYPKETPLLFLAQAELPAVFRSAGMVKSDLVEPEAKPVLWRHQKSPIVGSTTRLPHLPDSAIEDAGLNGQFRTAMVSNLDTSKPLIPSKVAATAKADGFSSSHNPIFSISKNADQHLISSILSPQEAASSVNMKPMREMNFPKDEGPSTLRSLRAPSREMFAANLRVAREPFARPVDVGLNNSLPNLDKQELEKRLMNRVRAMELTDPHVNPAFWIYYSDLDSIINWKSLQYVYRQSFSMGSGVFKLVTKARTIEVPYGIVLWR